MFQENLSHFTNFVFEEMQYRKKKKEMDPKNKKRNFFMFSLTHLFIILLVLKILKIF